MPKPITAEDAADTDANHRTTCGGKIQPDQEQPTVERWAQRAYYEGRSAGAAARDLISDLGANGRYPRLHALLSDLMDDFNRRGNENAQTMDLLREVVAAIPKH